MRDSTRLCCALLAAGTLMCGFLGCARTPQPRFYLLGTPPGLTAQTRVAQEIAVTVGPIQLPEYLDRPQIVTRSGSSNEVRLAQFDRWAEPLKDTFGRVLADNLSVLLSTQRVTVFPRRGSGQADYQVTVDVTRFDGEPGGEVVLSARWTILKGSGGEAVVTRKFHLNEPVVGDDFAALVTAKSQALAQLSREIAAAVGQAAKPESAP